MTNSADNQHKGYNIKAVALQTGVNAATIRSWERRYGLPSPQRSDSGHRRYSMDDIAIIRWLSDRQAEGISIRQAVEMWHQEGEAETKIAPALPPEPRADLLETLTLTNDAAELDTIASLRRMWIDACLKFDKQAAEAVLSEAFARFSPEVICLQLMQAGMVELGRRWESGEVTIQQEHFASALTMHRLEMLLAAVGPPILPERIIVGCAPDDYHTFSPMLLTYLLRRRGWEVIYLGANVPAVEFDRTVQQVQPDLVIISAQRLYTAATTLDIARLIQDHDVNLAYGGQIFNREPDLHDIIPGHFLGSSIEAAVNNVAIFLRERPAKPLQYAPASPAYQQALQEYRVRLPLIESHVLGLLLAADLPIERLPRVNLDMSQAIGSALRLGRVSLLGREWPWIENLLISHDMSPEMLNRYLTAYHQAAVIHLGQPGQLIVEWLKSIVDSQTLAMP